MGVLETQRLIAVVSAGEEDNGACGRGRRVSVGLARTGNQVEGAYRALRPSPGRSGSPDSTYDAGHLSLGWRSLWS
jgi:hypothetical protein